MNHLFSKTAGRIALGFLVILASIGMWAIEDLIVNGPDRQILKAVGMGAAFGLSLILVGTLVKVMWQSQQPGQQTKDD